MDKIIFVDNLTKDEINEYVKTLNYVDVKSSYDIEKVGEVNLFLKPSNCFVSLFSYELILKLTTKKVKININIVSDNSTVSKIIIDWVNQLKIQYKVDICVASEYDEIKTERKLVKDNYVTIFTDGACSGNPGKGGWGAVLIHGSSEKEISGYEEETTNNKMEITAVIKALNTLKQPCRVDLFSDSAYVCNAILQGWLENWKNNGWIGSDKKAVKNIELWKELDCLMKIHQVTFHKVKGHSDNELNNRCDELATGEIAKHN